MREIIEAIKHFFKELFKSEVQKEAEWREKQKKMCEGCIRAGVCPKDCSICAWSTDRGK